MSDSDIFKGWDSGKESGIWQDWTPIVTYDSAGTADPDSDSSVFARYMRIGNTVWATLSHGFTVGTGDRTRVDFTLPVTAKADYINGAGFENIVTATPTTRPVYTFNSGTEVVMYTGEMTRDGYLRLSITYEAA